MKYFRNSFIIAILGLVLAFFIGGPAALWVTSVLSILEVSLSFDNAVLNARILSGMDELWRRRFITWGMAIAVFGMRMLFPLVIVSVASSIDPWSALMLAIHEPEEYKHSLESVHTGVMGFGGSFLMMTALKFFINHDKEVHWLESIEQRLTTVGKIEAVQAAVVLSVILLVSNLILRYNNSTEALSFLTASVLGMVLFILVDGLEVIIGSPEVNLTKQMAKTGLAGFMYLEMVDASFSFDGVLGALALSNDIFIIAIGLGIGAMFVRSLTILMVDKGTVESFIFLEHGAFYAIFGLAVIMFVNTLYEIPETITGLVGAAFIVASLISSISYNRKHVEVV